MTDHINLYSVFSQIPLDIEGSNLEKTGWVNSSKNIAQSYTILHNLTQN